jgi:hypothetical protein
VNLNELIAAGWVLNSTSLSYQIYSKDGDYRVYNRDTDVSELYTQDLSKINIFVRIREMQHMITKLSTEHGLIV